MNKCESCQKKLCVICQKRPQQGGEGCNEKLCKVCDHVWYKSAARGAMTLSGNPDTYAALEWAAKRARSFAK